MDANKDIATTDLTPADEFLTGKPPRRRRRERTQFSPQGLRRLEAVFVADRYPDINVREALADELAVTEDRIQTWFQNRRSRQKRRLGNAMTPTSFHTNQKLLFPSAYGSPMGSLHINVCPAVVTSPIVQPSFRHSMWTPLKNNHTVNTRTPKPLVQVKPMIHDSNVVVVKKELEEEYVDVVGVEKGKDSTSKKENTAPDNKLPTQPMAATPITPFRPWETPTEKSRPDHFLYMAPQEYLLTSPYAGLPLLTHTTRYGRKVEFN